MSEGATLKMSRKRGVKGRWFLPAVVGTVLIVTLAIGAFAYLELTADWMVLVPDLTSDHSNISGQGIITEIYPNFTSYELGGPHTKPYHVFSEVIVVNLTKVFWTTDELNSSLDYWKSAHSLGVQFRDVSIAYDASDVPVLYVGGVVEFTGYFQGITDGVNSFFITISPSINRSYLKLSDFPAPDVKPISPHYLRTTPDLFGNFTETKIFLLDATPRYGYYNETVQPNNPAFPKVQKGDPVFIINVTLRDDYTLENPPPGGFGGNNASTIILKTQLYDKNGAIEAHSM
jgi:hypothetical protein